MAIPSKVFEYMRFDAWLLALADEGSASQQLLVGSGADVVDPTDVNGIARVLSERYGSFKLSGPPRQPALIARCSRREQARILFEALEPLGGGAGDLGEPLGRRRASGRGDREEDEVAPAGLDARSDVHRARVAGPMSSGRRPGHTSVGRHDEADGTRGTR